MNTYTKLAQTFFHNWIKTPTSTIELNGDPAFTQELKKLGCNSINIPLAGFLGGNIDTVEYLTCLRGFEQFDELVASSFLRRAKSSLAQNGLLFLRVPDAVWGLDRFLELLWNHPHFKIAETYTIGNERDYLLRPIDRRPTICIGMIAKNEERDLPRCLESLEGVADGLVLMDTGSTDKTKDIARQWADNQAKIYPHFVKRVGNYLEASEQDETGDWKLWNFGKARNAFVDRIESLGFDYILWMDADDKLLDKKIKNLIFLDQYVIHGVQIESGGSRWPHHRLWKAGKGVHYTGWCHEYPKWKGSDLIHQDISIFHDAAPGAHENSNDRNLRILKKEIEAEPSPRVAFYLANTYKDRGLYAEAIPAYQKRMDFGMGYEDEYWFAVLYKARCERAAGKVEDAKRTLRYAISKRPDWAEFPMELSYIENAAGNYHKAIGWALLAMDLPIPPTQLWREKDKYTDQPYRTISWAYEYLCDIPQSLFWAAAAQVKIGKPDAGWSDRIKNLKTKVEKRPPVQTLDADRDTQTVEWHRPGAIGDVLMTLNLIEAYKEKNPGHRVVYRTHPSTRVHLEKLILQAGADYVVSTDAPHNPHHRTINLVGYPLREGYPEKPMSKHLLEYFANEVGLEGKDFALKLPQLQLPRAIPGDYISLHVKAGWSPYKNWEFGKWEELCTALRDLGILLVQIGGPDDPQVGADVTVMGSSFMENLAVLSNARMHIGIDSWSNHATNIEWTGKGKTPAVILWGSTQATAAGYGHNINISKGLPCQPCFREDPKLSAVPRGVCPNPGGQLFEAPRHACMAKIEVSDVLGAVLKVWDKRGQ